MLMQAHYHVGKFLSLTFIGLCMVACSNDTLPPQVTISTPAEEVRLATGMPLNISVSYADNDILRQYKLDIHPNFDDHSHGKPAGLNPDWDTIIVGDLAGSTQSIQQNLVVPQNIRTGEYHLTAFALDVSGNEGRFTRVFYIYDVQDTVKPTVSFSAPVENTNFSGALLVEGQMSDLTSSGATGAIGAIFVRLVRADSPTQVTTLGTFLESTNFNGAFDPATGVFSRNFNVSNGISSGAYKLRVEVVDETGNQTFWERNVNKN
jgi:hypothetical protein